MENDGGTGDCGTDGGVNPDIQHNGRESTAELAIYIYKRFYLCGRSIRICAIHYTRKRIGLILKHDANGMASGMTFCAWIAESLSVHKMVIEKNMVSSLPRRGN